MTATMTAPTSAPSALPAAATTSPSIVRLTGVELRKMTDTRAGFWLLVVTALSAVVFVALQLIFGDPQGQTFAILFQSTLLPTGILLPVLGILSVTSEWTQRTALTTFALVPRRSRILTAKVLAAVVLAVLSIAAGLVTAALGNLAGIAFGDADGSWDITGTAIPYAVLFNVINILMGTAFGMLLINSAVAIVLYFLLPTVWAALGELIRVLRTPSEWLDLSRTTVPLVDDVMTADAWPKLAVSVGAWVLLPLAAGLVRLLRREVA